MHSRKKYKNWSNFIKLPPFPLLAHVGPKAVWGPLGWGHLAAMKEQEMWQQRMAELGQDQKAS